MSSSVRGTSAEARRWHDLLITNRRPQLRIVAPAASPEEAAAVIAALEQFLRDTAPPAVPAPRRRMGEWERAALLEGVSLAPDEPTPWGP